MELTAFYIFCTNIDGDRRTFERIAANEAAARKEFYLDYPETKILAVTEA